MLLSSDEKFSLVFLFYIYITVLYEGMQSTLFYVSHRGYVAIGCVRLLSVMGGLW